MGIPFINSDVSGTDREDQKLRGECSSQLAVGRTETSTDGLCYLAVFPGRRSICLLVCTAAGYCNSGFSGLIQEEDMVYLHGDSPKDLECGPGHI